MNSFVHHFHFYHILREELCWSVLSSSKRGYFREVTFTRIVCFEVLSAKHEIFV